MLGTILLSAMNVGCSLSCRNDHGLWHGIYRWKQGCHSCSQSWTSQCHTTQRLAV